MNDDDVATITVPQAYAGRFRDEALWVLGNRAYAIHEIADWAEQKRKRGEQPTMTVGAEEFEEFHAAERLYLQGRSQDGELSIEAPMRLLAAVVQGCEQEAGNAVKVAVENVGDGDVRSAIAELAFWHEWCEEFGGRERLARSEAA